MRMRAQLLWAGKEHVAAVKIMVKQNPTSHNIKADTAVANGGDWAVLTAWMFGKRWLVCGTGLWG